MEKLEKKNPAKTTKVKPSRTRKSVKPAHQDEENHRIIVENSEDGAFIMQRNTIAIVNGALTMMTGYRSKKMIGMDFKSLLPPDSAFLGPGS